MLTGKRFELTKCALGVEMGTEGSWISIPIGATIEVVSGPDGEGDHRFITVVWEKRLFAVFAIELMECGTEIKDRSASA